MADYVFDGKVLKNKNGQRLGKIDRNFVMAWNSARLGEIERNNIRNPQGKKILEFDGKTVKDDLGKKMATIKDIQTIVDGEPGIEMVAAWYFFIKSKQLNFT
jgi:hypothetical protein